MINIQNKSISNNVHQELSKERINAMEVQHRMEILEKRVQSPKSSVNSVRVENLNGNGNGG